MKTIPDARIVGQQGINPIERIMLEMGFGLLPKSHAKVLLDPGCVPLQEFEAL